MDEGNLFAAELTLTADCIYCDRSEEFENRSAGQAWLTSHIQESHPDELPEF